MDDDVAWAKWWAFDDVQVTTVLAGEGDAHARIHLVDTTRPVTAVEGDFAIEYRYDSVTDEYEREELNGPDALSRAFVSSARDQSDHGSHGSAERRRQGAPAEH